MVTPQLLNFSLDAWVKALEATVSESGRQLNTSKLSTIEFSPPDGPELPVPAKVLFPTAKWFRSNISEKPRSFEVYLRIIVLLKNMSRKKSHFFAFFAKICKKTLIFAFSAAILYIYSIPKDL